MGEELKVKVFIESRSETFQAADMDTVGHPVCTGTNTTDWESGSLGKGGRIVPQEHMILLDAASRAAEKLGLALEIIDISDLGFFQKRKMKQFAPRVEIGEVILTGLPTSSEIVEKVRSVISARL